MKQSNGGYVFLMESSTIEYIMERDCDLSKVGGELDSKSHRIGMKKNAPFHAENIKQFRIFKRMKIFTC